MKITQEQLKQALLERYTSEMYEKISNASVAIAGLGGLGSNVAVMLARAGVGHLLLADFDTVEITNLNRQAYTCEHLGKKKTEALSEILKDIIKQLGAEPVVTTPQKHDEAAALISHMPMLIAQAIFKTAQENELAMQIASSGFRDMTRLAMSNPEMADDMIQMNADNIQTSILKLYKTIGDLTKSNYLEQINEIKSKRRLMKF